MLNIEFNLNEVIINEDTFSKTKFMKEKMDSYLPLLT